MARAIVRSVRIDYAMGMDEEYTVDFIARDLVRWSINQPDRDRRIDEAAAKLLPAAECERLIDI